LQVRIFFAANEVPPALEVAFQGIGAYEAKAVLFGDVFYFDDD
jgi:hypothetical protein